MVSIVACSVAKPKKETKIWFIDKDELVLYRYINDGDEEYIPIKGNIEVENFFCTSIDNYVETILK